jgi:hypothetical protein
MPAANGWLGRWVRKWWKTFFQTGADEPIAMILTSMSLKTDWTFATAPG